MHLRKRHQHPVNIFDENNENIRLTIISTLTVVSTTFSAFIAGTWIISVFLLPNIAPSAPKVIITVLQPIWMSFSKANLAPLKIDILIIFQSINSWHYIRLSTGILVMEVASTSLTQNIEGNLKSSIGMFSNAGEAFKIEIPVNRFSASIVPFIGVSNWQINTFKRRTWVNNIWSWY